MEITKQTEKKLRVKEWLSLLNIFLCSPLFWVYGRKNEGVAKFEKSKIREKEACMV